MAKRPLNLLLVTASHLRADLLGFAGHPTIGTTYLDQLARDGIVFESCYTSFVGGAASRIGLLTSTWASEHQRRGPQATIPAHVPSLITELRLNGYRTGLFGRGLGLHPDDWSRLFVELSVADPGAREELPEFQTAYSAFTIDADHPLHRTSRSVEEAVHFIQRQRSNPWLAWVDLADPLPPFAAPVPYDLLFSPEDVDLPPAWPRYTGRHEPARNEAWRVHSGMRKCAEAEIRKLQSVYLGLVRLIDDQIGRLVRTLDETKQTADTLIVFTADHGDLLGYRGLVQAIPVFYDVLTRIPLVIRHPLSKFKGRRFKGLVEQVDIAPTLLEMLEIGAPPTMTGTSWLGDLEMRDDTGKPSVLCEAGLAGPAATVPESQRLLKLPDRETLNGPGAMLRKGNFKLCLYAGDQAELFDLETDPRELENLYEKPDFVDVREELTTDLAKRLLSIKLRPLAGDWPTNRHPVDVRVEPIDLRPEVPLFPELKNEGRRHEAVRYLPPTPVARREAPKSTRVPFTRPEAVSLAGGGAPAQSAAKNRSLSQILFICTGNYYRSRFTEAFFNYYANILNLRWSAFSRGLDISLVEGDISPITQVALEERDISAKYTAATRIQLTLDDLQRAQRIIVLDENEHRPMLQKLFPAWVEKVEFWHIRDTDQEAPLTSIPKMERAVSDLLKSLEKSSRAGAAPSGGASAGLAASLPSPTAAKGAGPAVPVAAPPTAPVAPSLPPTLRVPGSTPSPTPRPAGSPPASSAGVRPPGLLPPTNPMAPARTGNTPSPTPPKP